MSKSEAHSLGFTLSFLEKWTKDNMIQGAGYRGVYVPNKNISVLQVIALEILRSCRQIRPQRQHIIVLSMVTCLSYKGYTLTPKDLTK